MSDEGQYFGLNEKIDPQNVYILACVTCMLGMTAIIVVIIMGIYMYNSVCIIIHILPF